MQIQAQIQEYIARQPEPKRSDMHELHHLILEIQPGSRLWFLDGKNSENNIVSNPNIGYGQQTIKSADGKTKEFYQIGLSANTTGISVYILGIKDKTYLARTYGDKIGKANVTGYCIKFKTLQDINITVLAAAIRYGLKVQNTLLLTSGGIRFSPVADEFVKLLSKPPETIKMAHIMTASKMAHHLTYLEEDKAAFARLKIPYEDIDIEGMTEGQLREKLPAFDVIYVQGGDPFYLLKHMKLSGFDVVIKELINEGKLYVGVSAGSYVACPTMESTLWKKPQRARHGLGNDEPALNLINFLVAVHYKEIHMNAVKSGIARTKLPVRILTDNQALLVRGDKVELVGEGEEIRL